MVPGAGHFFPEKIVGCLEKQEPKRAPIAPEPGQRQEHREGSQRPGPRDQIDSTRDRETRTAAHEPPAQPPGAVRSPPPSIVATVRKGKRNGLVVGLGGAGD